MSERLSSASSGNIRYEAREVFGVWCDQCALPSRVDIYMSSLAPSGVFAPAGPVAWYCTEHTVWPEER